MACNKCGKCCECISLDKAHYTDWKNLIEKDSPPPKGSDADFVFNSLIEISEKSAKEINPWLFDEKSGWLKSERLYFVCVYYDKKNKVCSIHKDRPYLCAGYPFYDKNKKPDEIGTASAFYNPQCGYVEENKERLKRKGVN